MKRTLFLALGLLFISAVSVAQTDAQSQAIIDRFYQTVGGASDDGSSPSMLMEVQVSTGGMGIPMKIIKGEQLGCFRIELTVPGQGTVLMVTDGAKGWVAAKGAPVQALPKLVIDQMVAQGDVSGMLSVDKKNFDYTYIGEEKGNEVIEGRLKAGSSSPVRSIVLSFSAQTGLLGLIRTTDDKGKSAEVAVSDYKKFRDAMVPTRLETIVSEAQNAVITIKNVEFGIPTEAWMFAKPEAIK